MTKWSVRSEISSLEREQVHRNCKVNVYRSEVVGLVV